MSAPTLLLGLGGRGCTVVERVSKMLSEKQRNNTAFVAFDTDINDLRGIQERNPFIYCVQTSTKLTVGEYLNLDTHARDTWFPVNRILNGKTMTEGAGQVRAMSRLAFESAVRAGKMEPLHEAIQNLYKVEEDKPDQALRVVLVSSLAGGTGSGLVLPVALYVRNYLKTHFRQSANITRGFFILPEVFYEVIPGQVERNNLKANAYATLRELDAFLMKGDDTLHERYTNSVKMQVPRVASDEYEEYDIRPYDFCFLFDAQNAEGGKLNSFEQYLDHAANCIYAMSVGPMNKRSNSSEDNTIRKLAKERGRNRYAGAGVSMLIYPFEDIRNLLAMKWARQCVSKQWMFFDERYKEVCKENEEKRKQGVNVTEQSLTAFYVNQVESSAKHDDAFAKAIIKASGNYSNGVTRTGDRWKEYVLGVMNKVKEDLEACTSDLSSKKTDAKQQIDNLGTTWEEYADAYAATLEYKLMAEAYEAEVSQTIAYSMFRGAKPLQNEKCLPYRLETYLSTNNQFLHPNAIRYMLTKILDLMKKKKEAIDKDKKGNEDYFETFEEKTFDDANTEGTTETPSDLADRRTSIVAKLTKRPDGQQDELKRKIKAFFDKVGEQQVYCAQSFVIGQGMDYIQSLIEAFENFYKTFDSKVGNLDREISDIYRKFSSSKGTTVRYVCATQKCFDRIYETKPYMGGTISIDSELAKDIYVKVHDYALKKEKPNASRYFSQLFDDGIIGYFEKSVMNKYGQDLDVDIITAIENEAAYEGLFEETENPASLIERYVGKVIEDTRSLSCPFIESPMGESREPIHSCAFSRSMKPDKGDESPHAQIIRKKLMNYGGSPDEDVSKHEVMFYQSFYGLRATDLSKFAPPEKSVTYNRNSGEYFKAYYELVSDIHPEPHRSREISPHMDRFWHVVTKMPDLDDENQKKQEYEIYAAFFWAVTKGYIYLTEEGNGLKRYKLNNILLKMESDSLIVSNGTACDKLYEVLDAIAIYPELVHRILKEIEMLTERDVNESDSLEAGLLYTALKDYCVMDPGLGKDNAPSYSIFDLPLLMKKTSATGEYYEADVVEILNVEIKEICRYLSRFFNSREMPAVAGAIIMKQFELHLTSLKQESQKNRSVYRESLFKKVCDTITSALNDMGLREEAQQVQEQSSALRKQETMICANT